MAVTIAIKLGGEEELALTFDAPRIAIGRGKSCDLLLPDASVGKRHASIRQEGGRTIIVDEGSANGVIVDGLKLPAQTPHTLGDGDVVRVGRVWLEVRQAGGVASSAAEMKRVPLELCRRQLASAGEAAAAAIDVLEAPELAGPLRLELGDTAREYVLGRGRDCDLPLPDEKSSRRHAAIAWHGDGWTVRDLGSKQGTFARAKDEEVAVGEKPRPWRDGEVVRIGDTLCRLSDPVAQLFDEMLAAAEVKMRPEELREPPPGPPATDRDPDPERDPDPVPDFDRDPDRDRESESDPELAGRRNLRSRPSQRPSGAGLAALDTAVVLVALGLLALSLAGLFWLLH